MTTASDLISYWSQLNASRRPLIHPEDHIPDELRAELSVAGIYPDEAGYEEAIDRVRFHVNLVPVPFIGDIANARVFVLLLNPGCSPLDYVAEADPEFSVAIVDQLSQSFRPGIRSFFCLRREFSWTGAGQWWRSKLSPVVQQFRDRGLGVSDALDRISSQFAVLEYWPYHSINANLRSSILKHSKSHRIVSSFARDELSDRARRGECLVVVPRAVKRWDLPEHKNVIQYDRGASRGASLAQCADRIYEFLR